MNKRYRINFIFFSCKSFLKWQRVERNCKFRSAIFNYTSAVRVCKKIQTQTLSITESKHFCFSKPAKIQYIMQHNTLGGVCNSAVKPVI
jgi:hypothetical protein